MRSKYTSQYLREWRETHDVSASVLFSVSADVSRKCYIVQYGDVKVCFSSMSSVLDFINSNIV